MSAVIPADERVTFERLAWITACLALAMLPYVAVLPLWVTASTAAAAALRLALAARGRRAPPSIIRIVVSLLAIGLLFLQYRTFNGLSAGTALLCLIAGLKLLETQARRDIYVVTMIIYFLSLAALLAGESFWLFTYLVGVTWLTTASLLRLTGATSRGHRRGSLRCLLHDHSLFPDAKRPEHQRYLRQSVRHLRRRHRVQRGHRHVLVVHQLILRL